VAKCLFGLSLSYEISKQALTVTTTSAHAGKGFDRRKIHRHNPDGAISFHDPLQLGWTEGEGRPNRSRDDGLPPGGDGAAHGLARTAWTT
jgi:hypothetical protein